VTDNRLGWFSQLRERLSEDELVEAVTIARLLWLCRNATVFRREFLPPLQVVRSAADSMAIFKAVACQEQRS
jgi:hypothetical protein